jgi:hypothetical protein
MNYMRRGDNMEIKIGQKAIVVENDGTHNFPVGMEITFIGTSKTNDDWFNFAGINEYGEKGEQYLIVGEFELKS